MHCLLTRLVMQIGDAFALVRNIEERRNRLRIEDMLGRWRMLTMREQEVAKLVASDMLNKQIAIDLDIQEHTVKIHRSNACRKLGVRSALELHGFLKDIGAI